MPIDSSHFPHCPKHDVIMGQSSAEETAAEAKLPPFASHSMDGEKRGVRMWSRGDGSSIGGNKGGDCPFIPTTQNEAAAQASRPP